MAIMIGAKIKKILSTELQEDGESDISNLMPVKLPDTKLTKYPLASKWIDSISNGNVEIKDRAKFIKWRNEYSTFFAHKCSLFRLDLGEKKQSIVKDIINFPKCMVRTTWEFCGCDSDCVNNVLSGIDYRRLCPYWDASNPNENLVESDCNFLRIKFNKYSEDSIPENELMIKRNFKKKFNNICNKDNNSVEVLRCLAYELNAKCDTDLPCVDSNRVINHVCERGRINSKLEDDRTIFYFPSFKYVNQRRQRSIKEDLDNASGEIINRNQSNLALNFTVDEIRNQNQSGLETSVLLAENVEYSPILYISSMTLVIFFASGVIAYSIRAIKDKSYPFLIALIVGIIMFTTFFISDSYI